MNGADIVITPKAARAGICVRQCSCGFQVSAVTSKVAVESVVDHLEAAHAPLHRVVLARGVSA